MRTKLQNKVWEKEHELRRVKEEDKDLKDKEEKGEEELRQIQGKISTNEVEGKRMDLEISQDNVMIAKYRDQYKQMMVCHIY